MMTGLIVATCFAAGLLTGIAVMHPRRLRRRTARLASWLPPTSGGGS